MPHRIAVFNHSPNVLLLIESILKKKGFEVFTFLETLTDINKVVELAPDLVIIGHVNGYTDQEYEIVYQFRTNPQTDHVPIIVCTTGAAQVHQSGRLNDVSHISIVPKPFDVQELVKSVQQALGIHSGVSKGNTPVSDASSAL